MIMLNPAHPAFPGRVLERGCSGSCSGTRAGLTKEHLFGGCAAKGEGFALTAIKMVIWVNDQNQYTTSTKKVLCPWKHSTIHWIGTTLHRVTSS